jgi:oligopeptide/dipeptide ABC transporter ATP-binding protein
MSDLESSPTASAPPAPQPEASQRGKSHVVDKEPPLLRVDNLTKVFQVRRGLLSRDLFATALSDVSLEVNAGETLGVVGESGSGKTILGRCVLRLIPVDYGRIYFDGEDLAELTARHLKIVRARMQPIFQDPRASLNPVRRIWEIVSEGKRIAQPRTSDAQLREHAAYWLSQVGLPLDFEQRHPLELSAGELQRVVIARALCVSPRLLVLDEPLSALDVSARAQVVNLLLDLQERYRSSGLFISHDLRLVRYMSHRIVVMILGHVVEAGSADDVYTRSLHPYTRALLSARQSPGAERRGLRVILDGPSPDPTRPPQGCPFHPRCPRAEPGLCDVDQPELLPIEDGSEHRVACYFPCV